MMPLNTETCNLTHIGDSVSKEDFNKLNSNK